MTESGSEPASRWATERSDSATHYDAKWRRMAAAGQSVHGEADFVSRFEPDTVLDAGCGTGRVAIELAARGIDVVGVDLDAAMLEQARSKAPTIPWLHASVDDVAVGRKFDVVVTAGNVMIFVTPGTETAVVANLAGHLAPEGVLISGFQLRQRYGVDEYDADCTAAGLTLIERYGTWAGAPWEPANDYAVNVHRRAI